MDTRGLVVYIDTRSTPNAGGSRIQQLALPCLQRTQTVAVWPPEPHRKKVFVAKGWLCCWWCGSPCGFLRTSHFLLGSMFHPRIPAFPKLRHELRGHIVVDRNWQGSRRKFSTIIVCGQDSCSLLGLHAKLLAVKFRNFAAERAAGVPCAASCSLPGHT